MNKKSIMAACLAMFACACQSNNAAPNMQPEKKNDQPTPCGQAPCNKCPAPCPAPAPRGGCCETEKKPAAAPAPVVEQKAVEQKTLEQKSANLNVSTPEVKVETKTP